MASLAQRGDFETIQSIVLRNKPYKRWDNIHFYIFDVPKQSGGLLKRLTVLEKYLQSNPSAKKIIQIIPQVVIKSKAHLRRHLTTD